MKEHGGTPRTPSLEMPPEKNEWARPLAVERKSVFSGQSHRRPGGRRLNEDWRFIIGREGRIARTGSLSEIGREGVRQQEA